MAAAAPPREEAEMLTAVTRTPLACAAVSRLVLAASTLSLLLIVLVPAQDASDVVAGLTVLLVTSAIGARYAAVVLGAGTPHLGVRAEAHRHALDRVPAPRHPRTAGRPSPRAPSGVATAA